MSPTKTKLFDLLAEVRTVIRQSTSQGEPYAENLDVFDDWAAELAMSLGTLKDLVDQHVD